MKVIPAIDLKEGKCVRLKQGRMEDATVFSEDPLAVARHWRPVSMRQRRSVIWCNDAVGHRRSSV